MPQSLPDTTTRTALPDAASQEQLQTSLRPAWILAAVLALADLAGAAALGFTAPVGPIALVIVAAAAALAVAYVYRRLRPDPRLALIAEAAALLVCFTFCIAIASYLSESIALPLRDDVFAKFDAWIGFDFPAHLAWLRERPMLSLAISGAYLTSILQVVIVVLCLPLFGETERLRRYLLLFVATCTSVIVVAALMPTLGPCGTNALTPADMPRYLDADICFQHLPHLEALRDGTMRRLPLDDIRGLVAFPSFHTALAVITIWATMTIRPLAAPIFALNAMLLFATPSNGSHYAADLVGGAVIAFVAIAAIDRSPRSAATRAKSALPADARTQT